MTFLQQSGQGRGGASAASYYDRRSIGVDLIIAVDSDPIGGARSSCPRKRRPGSSAYRAVPNEPALLDSTPPVSPVIGLSMALGRRPEQLERVVTAVAPGPAGA